MNAEVTRFLEANPELLTAFSDTFIARWDTYPYQLEDGSYYRAHTKQADGTIHYHPLTTALIEGHLKGNITLGAYVMDATSTTTKIILDADDEARFADLHRLSDDLAKQNVPAYLEQSRRGGHLWLFTPPLKGIEARRFGKYLLAERGIQHVELYPKQHWVKKDRVGSLIRLPFGRHRLTGQQYGFITPDGKPLAPRLREQLAIVAYPDRVPQVFIDGILAIAPEAKPIFAIDHKRISRHLADLPPDKKIKAAISPRDFISQYVELDSAGRGLCPWHDDHRYSFAVYEDNWHCFAGCEGQTIIDFYIKLKGYPSLRLDPNEWNAVLKELLVLLGL